MSISSTSFINNPLLLNQQLGTGGTTTPAPNPQTPAGLPPLTGIGPVPMAPEIRQALTQILGMLQALAGSLINGGNVGTGGTTGIGTGGTAGLIGTGGTTGLSNIGTGGTTDINNLGIGGINNFSTLNSFGGFSGVNGLNITSLPNPPQLAPAPVSFFTPIALPTAIPPVVTAPPQATVQTPAAKIALTSGEELQQRIQLFNQSNPGNIAGLAQFLSSSYNNTSAFTPQADGTLLYTVSGKTFKIAANGLTPRVQVG